MGGIYKVRVVKYAFLDHRKCTFYPLFSKLEHYFHLTCELVFILIEYGRSKHTYGGVAIMTAGVHTASIYRGEILSVRLMFFIFSLVKVVTVYIKTHGHCFAWLS